MNARAIHPSLLAGLIATVGIVLACGFAGWLGNTYTEIDVNSGRLRTRLLILGVVVSESEEETSFSRAVARCKLQVAPADYRFACGTTVGLQKLFGTPMVSGHYGDAVATLRGMMVVFELHPSLLQTECDILGKLIKMLQAGDSLGMQGFVDGLDARESGGEGTG
jgi:hypothetical protein